MLRIDADTAVVAAYRRLRAPLGAIMNRTSRHHDSSSTPANPRQADPDLDRVLDAWLDEALEQTFPASDPIASPPGSAPSFREIDDEIDECNGLR